MNEPEESRLCISIITAMSRNTVIGECGRIPWHLPADLKRFKMLTLGHHVVMGRRTYESIAASYFHRNNPDDSHGVLKPVLDKRTVLVLSRESSKIRDEIKSGERNAQVRENVRVAGSLEEAIAIAERAGESEVFVAGGSEVYREALEIGDKLYLTIVDADFSGDAFFPAWDRDQWKPVRSIRNEADSLNPYAYTFLDYERA